MRSDYTTMALRVLLCAEKPLRSGVVICDGRAGSTEQAARVSSVVVFEFIVVSLVVVADRDVAATTVLSDSSIDRDRVCRSTGSLGSRGSCLCFRCGRFLGALCSPERVLARRTLHFLHTHHRECQRSSHEAGMCSWESGLARYFTRYTLRTSAYMSNPSVDMANRMSSPLIVLRFSTAHRSAASDVMNEMNSDVHSWTHSLASLLTLVVSGRHFFMIRPTLAIGK